MDNEITCRECDHDIDAHEFVCHCGCTKSPEAIERDEFYSQQRIIQQRKMIAGE